MDLFPRNPDSRLQPGMATAEDYYPASIGETLRAFKEEAFYGVGTGYADVQAFRVKEAERKGKPITEEEYKASSSFRPTMPYSRGMTDESAKILSQYHDEQEERANIIRHSSNGATALGYATAFTLGLVEPKNVATGIAGTALIGPFAWALPGVKNLKNIARIKAASGRYGAKAAIGGVEGMAGAAVAEPSNQYSAKILKQDYGMADTLWNLGLSATFGAGITAGPAFIKDKWQAYGNRTPEIVRAEYDMAVGQMATGQRVDVTTVERVAMGEISSKPIAEKAAAVEQSVRYTETPEFKKRFEGSKVVDAKGVPVRVLHGGAAVDNLQGGISGNEGIYFTDDAFTARAFADKAQRETGASATQLAYLNIKNPKVIDDVGFWQNFRDRNKPITKTEAAARRKESSFLTKEKIDELKAQGFDGIINKAANEYVVFSPDQIIPAFGEGNINNLASRIDADNAAVAQKALTDSVDPANDTAIDSTAKTTLDTLEETLPDQTSEKLLDDALAELSTMRKEGQLTEADEKAFLEAINALDENNLNAAYQAAISCLTRG